MNNWVHRLAEALPVVAAVVLTWLIVGIWAARFVHPYDLEWMEGGMLAHAWRLEHGLPLYPEPGREWVPFIYPAAFASLLALLGEVFGLDYQLGRGISIAGTLAAALAIPYAVRRDGGSWAAGLAGAAIFLGTYRYTGAFFDLVRLDGLNVGLVAWTIVLGLERRRGCREASALLLASAFLIKQHAAIFGVPIALALWLRDGRGSALRYFAWSAVPAIAVTAWLAMVTQGRYLTYVFAVPAAHGMVGKRVFPGTPRELGEALPIALAVATVFLVWRSAQRPGVRRPRLLLGASAIAALLGAVAAVTTHPVVSVMSIDGAKAVIGGSCTAAAILAVCWTLVADGRARALSWHYVYGVGVASTALFTAGLMRGHVGGFLNVHMQLFWVVGLAVGFAVARSWRASSAWWVWMGGSVAVSAQICLAIWLHDPAETVPTARDVRAGDALVAAVREAPGPIYSPLAPWIPVQAGHEPSVHLIALWDIDKRGSPYRGGADDFRDAMAEGYWPTAVDGSGRHALLFGVQENYAVGEVIVTDRRAFVPKTGWSAHPVSLRPWVGEAD